MAKRKITIEIEVDSMNTYDVDYTPEFTTKLQISIALAWLLALSDFQVV